MVFNVCMIARQHPDLEAIQPAPQGESHWLNTPDCRGIRGSLENPTNCGQRNQFIFQAKPQACPGRSRGTHQHLLPQPRAGFTPTHLPRRGSEYCHGEAGGAVGEEDEGSGTALLPSLAAPIAGEPSPASCPHGGHQQPSESAASTTPCKCIGSNT